MKQEPLTTDRQVAGLKAGAKPFEVPVAGARGLLLHVACSGAKTFVVRYVATTGVRRRFLIGNYPGVTLKAARERAIQVRADAHDGADPAAARVAARKKPQGGDTLGELGDAYFEAAARGLHGGRGRPKAQGTLKVERSRFDGHIRPKLGARRITDLRRPDIKGFMRELSAAQSLAADTIASIGGTLHNVLAFAVHEERLETNPATGLTRPLALRTRERMFDDQALAALWTHLDGDPKALQSSILAALKFALLTLCRRNEACGARWEEIDQARALWTIPPERTKNRKPHLVPLSEQAMALLQAVGVPEQGFVFPSPLAAAGEPGHISPDAFTRALARLLGRLELPHGSPHDFRRSGATTLTGEQLGVRQFIVGKILGHTSYEGAAVTGQVYDRNAYLKEKREGLALWGRYLETLSTGADLSDTVVPLRPSGRVA